jgi:hypothetical protein
MKFDPRDWHPYKCFKCKTETSTSLKVVLIIEKDKFFGEGHYKPLCAECRGGK